MGNNKSEVNNTGCKTIKRLFPAICIIVLTFCLVLPAVNLSVLYAAGPKDRLEKIEKRLLKEKKKVTKTIKKEKSILTALEKTNKALSKTRDELKIFDKRLSKTRKKIGLLEKEIKLLDKKLQTRKNILKDRLKSLYKQQYGNVADILVSAKDNKELIKRIRYIGFIADYDKKLMNSYNSEIKEQNIKLKSMEVLKKELELNKKNVRKKKADLLSEREKKDKLLASVKSERTSYEKMIKELQGSSKDLRKMIRELERKKIAEKYAVRGFRKLKGRLPWPVNGRILVPFGKQKDKKLNIMTFRKGVEIKSKLGNPVLAVSGGRIVFADWFKGYGQLLIVNHGGGYHTLYANLSEIFHKTGDIIKRRQAVGKIGESGLLNMPSLYFEIRFKGTPVNPLNWLRKMKK